ncbi:18638_t:CDS:2 [Acaulospora morrowiae]|uniref:18638_t:CDS:1 n=1 Tax=Acaulospora morrowiae TaxID=94023 RepID=A0A9N9BJ15_9GLOM|nr:18638_t:CDS:2 [Acaulospora morrowiae]
MEKLHSMLFRPKIAEALRCSNFETVADILHHNKNDLAKRLKLSGKEVSELVNTIMQEIKMSRLISYPPKNALMLLKEGTHRMLSTGDNQIDKIIGGGILSRAITEIVGESSVGKTQLCLQLCLTVQLPEELGGLNGGAVYISTEGNFHLKRYYQMVSSFQQKYSSLRDIDLAKNVHCVTVPDLETQRNVLRHQLPVLLSRNNIRLVIIDSVTANFRTFETSEFPNFRQRASEICQLGIQLKEISDRFNAPIVCVNQVSDNFAIEDFEECDDDAHYEYNCYQRQLLIGNGTKIPALGLTWSNIINIRIMLSRPKRILTEEDGSAGDNDPRTIALLMAPHAQRRFGEYYIDRHGIHGLVN